MRAEVLLLAFALGCARPPSDAAPAPVVAIAPARTDAGIGTKTDDDASRARLLEAIDAGDLARAEAALEGLERSPVTDAFRAALGALPPLAHAKPLAVAAPAVKANANRSKTANAAPVVATRAKSPPGTQGRVDEARYGESFVDGLGRPDEGKRPPPFVPARIGSAPLARLRAQGGRFVAMYRERFIAVFEEDGAAVALLDLASWASPAPGRRYPYIRDFELDRDVLYVSSDGNDVPFVAAIDVKSGTLRWSTSVESAIPRLAVVTDGVLAYQYRATQNGSGEILLFDRNTGAVKGRRATPEIEGGAEAVFEVGDGLVAAYASSELSGGKGLRHDEYLAIRIAATRRPPAGVPPKTAPRANGLAPTPNAHARDARLAAWRAIASDPRAAYVTLRREVDVDPTGLASSVLFATAEKALAEARARSEKEIAGAKTIRIADERPSGRAPITRPRARTLKLGARRAVTMGGLAAALSLDDDADVAPSFVPDTLLGRRRNDDGSDPGNGAARVDVFAEPYKTTLVVFWRDGRARAVFERDGDVRFAAATNDVAFVDVLVNGRFFLEARDVTSGNPFWRLPDVTDRAFVVRDGYVVLGGGTSQANELYLVEADSGNVVQRVAAGGAVELVLTRGGKILALVVAPPTTMELVEVALD